MLFLAPQILPYRLKEKVVSYTIYTTSLPAILEPTEFPYVATASLLWVNLIEPSFKGM